MESNLIILAYIFLMAAVIAGAGAIIRLQTILSRLTAGLIFAALLSVTAALASRSLAMGRLPFSSMYEFVVLFAWGIMLCWLIIRSKLRSPYFNFLAALLCIIILSLGSNLPSAARPLVPALQSTWLKFHVATAVLAYGAFGISFCLGLVCLWQERWTGNNNLSRPNLDKLIYQMVAAGFVFQTLVLITGAVWAEEVWGSWWNWDPKETWALITWLIYAGYLHARKTHDWRGKKAAIIAIAGFIIVLFTLFGVTLILPGAHSYV